jgi:hypothetical protein
LKDQRSNIFLNKCMNINLFFFLLQKSIRGLTCDIFEATVNDFRLDFSNPETYTSTFQIKCMSLLRIYIFHCMIMVQDEMHKTFFLYYLMNSCRSFNRTMFLKLICIICWRIVFNLQMYTCGDHFRYYASSEKNQYWVIQS